MVVWVTPQLNQQHRLTLDWLNQLSPDKFRVFGVELELLKILGSPPAPKFTVVSRAHANGPIKAPKPVPKESAQRRREYWQEFLRGLELDGYDQPFPKANTLGNLRFSLGRGAWVTVYAAASISRMGVFLRVQPAIYKRLHRQQRQISAKVGNKAYWSPEIHDKPFVGTSENCDPADRGDWERQHRWLKNQLQRFVTAFGKRVF